MFVLIVAAMVATVAATIGAFTISNPVLLNAAVSLGLASGVLIGVALAQADRSTPAPDQAADIEPESLDAAADAPGPEAIPEPIVEAAPGAHRALTLARRVPRLIAAARSWRPTGSARENLRYVLAGLGSVGIIVAQMRGFLPSPPPSGVITIVVILACFGAAGLAATAVRYLTQIDAHELPESAALARGGRLVTWILVLAAVSLAFQWAGLPDWLGVVGLVIALVNAAVCCELLAPVTSQPDQPPIFDADFGTTRLLGSRASLLGSVLDTAHAQLGIDLRSTWALTVVRQSVEPLAIALVFVGWLTTSLTVVGVDEQGLVERLGVPLGGDPLSPGIHLHLPWPVDRVFRIPVRRVQMLSVGHEGEEEAGPEDVLWAREHAKNEYTLLLGNGRDLITVDAGVQFRIADARAWHYRSQNPADALRAIAYRAVMRTTVNKTLAEALSENLVATTARMRAMVQEEADALGIGVAVLGFTVGGMHPPVMVAADYQAVVSAELGKVTAVVNAQAERNRIVPYAESEALTLANNARAEGAAALAKAAGEAWSFRALDAQYHASPGEYFFRRRLETLERTLPYRRFAVVDFRFQRDGGELWITP